MHFVTQIVEHITSPPREEYNPLRLGPNTFTLPSQTQPSFFLNCQRQDYSILNHRQQALQISFYSNHFNNSRCVIYLHANSSCRLQGSYYSKRIMGQGYSYCTFDFAGSGISQGEHSSAGYQESHDINAVVQHLLARGVKEIVLWGRSMGAVAAFIYAARAHPAIKGLILDKALIKQRASEVAGLPQGFFVPMLYCVDNTLKEKVDVGLDDLKLKKYLASPFYMALPALFVVSQCDRIVGCHHTLQLSHCYPCEDKQILYIQNNHNQARSEDAVEKILSTVREWWKKQEPRKKSLKLLLGLSSRSDAVLSSQTYKLSLSAMRNPTNRSCFQLNN